MNFYFKNKFVKILVYESSKTCKQKKGNAMPATTKCAFIN
jgi:hypothetical protein